MKTLNKITIAGNLGQDPEYRELENGTLIVNLSIATSSYMGKDKQTEESKFTTHWHRCVAYGHIAPIIAKYCSKGVKLYVEGELRYRNYENSEGIKVYLSEIVISDFLLMGTGQTNANQI